MQSEGMKEVCSQWGMKYTDAFAGWQLLRPYTKNKLLTKKVEKAGISFLMQMSSKCRWS